MPASVSLTNHQTRTLFRQASELEQDEPQQAVLLYQRLEKDNTEFHREILVVATVCPLLASAVAFFVGRAVDMGWWYGAFTSLAIIGGLGFLPATVMFGYRLRQKGFEPPGNWWLQLCLAPLYTFLALFHIAIVILAAFVYACILMIPILVLLELATSLEPAEWPTYAFLLLYSPAALLVVLVLLADVKLMPFDQARISSELVLGLWVNRNEGFRIFAGIVVVAVLASDTTTMFGLVHRDLHGTLLANGLAGALLGLSLSPLSKDFLLADLIRLGRVRCLLLLQRTLEARLRLKQAYEQGITRSPDVEYLLEDLLEVVPGPLQGYLYRGPVSGAQMDRNRRRAREIFEDTVARASSTASQQSTSANSC